MTKTSRPALVFRLAIAGRPILFVVWISMAQGLLH